MLVPTLIFTTVEVSIQVVILWLASIDIIKVATHVILVEAYTDVYNKYQKSHAPPSLAHTTGLGKKFADLTTDHTLTYPAVASRTFCASKNSNKSLDWYLRTLGTEFFHS